MKKLIPVFLLCGCVNVNQYLSDITPLDPLYTANAMVGMNERIHRTELKNFMGIDPVRYEWCAAFVNAILHLHGIPGSESVSNNPLLARSFLYWGRYAATPQLGDIIVFPRGNQGWQGHVGFYVKTVNVDGLDHYIILGGNQDNQVSYELFPAHKAIAIRRWE
jgi:uncharacterized protein (TIGR02594 family)